MSKIQSDTFIGLTTNFLRCIIRDSWSIRDSRGVGNKGAEEPLCALNIVSGCHGEGKEPEPMEADRRTDRACLVLQIPTQWGKFWTKGKDQGIFGWLFTACMA